MAALNDPPHSSDPQRRRGSVRFVGNATLAALILTACTSVSTPSAEQASSLPGDATRPAPATTSSAAATPEPSTTTATASAVEEASTSAAETATAKSGTGLTSLTIDSTTEQYFVLYVRPDASSPRELPAAIVRGAAGTTTISDGRAALPEDRYRIVTEEVSQPGDVDGDGIDDLTELADPTTSNALNAAAKLDPADGRVYIADRATYEEMSYQGDDVFRDGYLAGLEFVKFWITESDTDRPSVWFMNTENYRAHPMFAEAVGIPGGRGPQPGKMRGDIVWEPEIVGPDGTPGVFRFAFQPNDAYPFAEIALAYESLITNAPFLANDLMYYPIGDGAKRRYENEKALYDASRVAVLVEI